MMWIPEESKGTLCLLLWLKLLFPWSVWDYLRVFYSCPCPYQLIKEGLPRLCFKFPKEKTLWSSQKCIIPNISQFQESHFCSWHRSLSKRKIRLMNDFHKALLRSPQIPLTVFYPSHILSVVMEMQSLLCWL